MQSKTTNNEEDDKNPPEAPAPSVLLNPPPAALKSKEPPSGEAQNHKKAVKSSQPVSLPQPLDTALLEHVELEVSNDPTAVVAKTDMSNRPIMKAMSVIGVDLSKIKLVFIRMLCSRWIINKKYRQASRVKCLELIAHHQLLGSYYRDQAKDVKLTNEEIQGSKMRLLNVIFSEEFFSDVVAMNDSKGRAELDAGKTGSNQRLWSTISESYNYSANNGEYGSLAFVEDIHVKSFVTTFDLQVYEQLMYSTNVMI
jgi:hypothetical protein